MNRNSLVEFVILLPQLAKARKARDAKVAKHKKVKAAMERADRFGYQYQPADVEKAVNADPGQADPGSDEDEDVPDEPEGAASATIDPSQVMTEKMIKMQKVCAAALGNSMFRIYVVFNACS